MPIDISSFKNKLVIPDYKNLTCMELGMDSRKMCLNKHHFDNYGEVSYRFNDMGFRWRNLSGELHDEVLVIGDSFTLGLGVNVEDTWPYRLEKIIGRRVLNFSLNGASNDWMARKTGQILQYFVPSCVIIHWSFSHRRENHRDDWFDNERTQSEPLYTDQENLSNWAKNYKSITHSPAIHSFIPKWHDDFDYSIVENCVLPPRVVDLARDGFHYGIKTHRLLAEEFAERLTNLRVL